jgi:hypothetical protein
MLLCLAFNGAVQAQDNCGAEVYAVTDIHLDENATTGMLAREQAIKAATEQAYQENSSGVSLSLIKIALRRWRL